MATNTPSPFGRQNTTQQVGYLSRDITFADGTGVLAVGWLPAGATVIDSGVVVSTAFNAGSGNTIDIGTAADPDGFASGISVATIGRILADDMATSNDLGPYAVGTQAVCQLTMGGSAATAGVARVYVAYLYDNEE